MKKTYTNKYSTGGGESNHKRITSKVKDAIKEILGDSTSLFLLGIFLLVSMVSIGYSALSSSLMVTGEANFRVREDVRITGIKVLSTSNSGGETYPSEYYKDGTKVMVTLPETNSIVTYEVEITNSTSFDYYLKSKSDVPSTNPQMKYEIQGLEVDETTIPKNSTMTFKIVVSYQDGTSEVPSNNTVIFETRFVFDILDVTPPTVSFSPQGGNYQAFQTVTITANDEHYDHMDVEVQNSNGKIEEKSQTNIKATTFEVSLDNYDTYKILVKAYDKRGNTQTNTPLEDGYTYQEYVIRKSGGNAAEQLKEKINPSDLTYTDSTDEQKRQMYAFEHEATEQTGALTDYRYIGNDPYNYVYFNCKAEPQNSSNCEKWMIIGIFSVDDGTGNVEERMKIIKAISIGTNAWDSNNRINNWETASLNTYLNGTYYDGLSDTAKAMIGDTKYYLGGSSTTSGLAGPDYYNFERGTEVYGSNPTSWVGKIALMYPSDYVYTSALGVDDKCYTNASSYGSTSWIVYYNYEQTNWTLSHNSDSRNTVFMVYQDRHLNGGSGSLYGHSNAVMYQEGVRPTLYLSSIVSIVDGDGSEGNPYQLDIPPAISFDYLSGTYYTQRKTITITVTDTSYSYMNVEVRNSKGKITEKSKNNIIENTYTVTFEEEGTYTISVTAHDENGLIAQSEQQYVIRKPVAVDKLKAEANSDIVTSYANGNKKEMFTFKHDATSQTEALTDYRYIGNTPNNYVYFNCNREPQNTSNCETWRIIGVFPVEDESGNWEERIKIIRNGSIGNKAWDSGNTNNWKNSSLQSELSGSYYQGLSDTAKAMIGATKYHLGGNDTFSGLAGPDYYKFERGTNTSSNTPFFWVGMIALMYPSDYIYTYALGVDETCYNNGAACRSSGGGTPSSGWLFNNQAQWNLNPLSSSSIGAFYLNSDGYVNGTSNVTYNVTNTRAVRPTLYLSSSVSIVDGDGSSGNPYQLAID